MWIADKWKDYELLDASGGEKLERWGDYILVRPDPQVIWNTERLHPGWENADGYYVRSSKGGGNWTRSRLPAAWQIGYGPLRFNLKPFAFKHTGIFPEQASNWDWFTSLINKAGRPVKVLNLFAYTGGATAAALKAGASVTHVDASKGMVSWAHENADASGLKDAPVRWIVDDCIKFAQREMRRGNKYDGIIMDPPSYGRGPKGETWKLEDSVYGLICDAVSLLGDDPLFFLISSYTTGLQPGVLRYMLSSALKERKPLSIEADELGLTATASSLQLPCGASGRAAWI